MKRIIFTTMILVAITTSAHAATRITVGSGGNGSASVPVATTSTAGKVKPDGSTITVETDGTIHAAATGSVTLGTANGLSLSGQVLSLGAATDSTAGAMSAADHAAMPTTLAKLVAIELAAAPRKIYMVYGDSTDGGDTPDSTTQASIDALLDAGVPQANIRWMYEVDDTNTFTIANLTDSTTIENVVLTQHGGTFAVADMGSGTAIDNVTISSGDVLVFAVADLAAATTIDNVVLSLAGGTLAVADMASATTTENVVLAAGTSAPTTPVISVTPGDGENVVALTSGGTGATSYDIKWGTAAGSRTNTIDWATIQAATSPDFPASAYIHTGRTNGTTYYYSLVATNAGGSTESAEVSGTPAVPLIANAFSANITPFIAGANNLGTFSVVGGAGAFDTTSGLVNYTRAITSQALPLNLEFDYKSTDGYNSNILVGFGVNSSGFDGSVSANRQVYYLQLVPSIGRVSIRRDNNTTISEITTHTFPVDTWETFRLHVATDGTMTAYINGVQVLSANDTTHTGAFVSAFICSSDGELAKIRNYSLKAY